MREDERGSPQQPHTPMKLFAPIVVDIKAILEDAPSAAAACDPAGNEPEGVTIYHS